QPWLLGVVALVGAGITAFYMSRVFFMTFHGERRWTRPAEPRRTDGGVELPQRDPHESPRLMTVPMVVLAIGSVLLGGVLLIGNAFPRWLEPVTGHVEHHDPVLPLPVIMGDRKSTRLNSSHVKMSYAVFC